MNFIKVFVNLFQFNRTNWKAVALCLFAATVFWIFNALNKEYTTNIRFPLRFDYNQERFIPIGNLPHQVNLNVSSNGWDLFRKSLGVRIPELVISLNRPTEVRKIVGSTLPPLFSNQLDGLQINYVLTDTLHLKFDDKDSHTFKIYPDLSRVSYREGFGRVSPIVILPDSVKLEGPRGILHQMPDSIALLLPEVTLDESFREEIEIVIPNTESMKRNPPVATAMFEVGALETIEAKIKVRLINVPVTVKSSNIDSVTMTVQIPKSKRSDFQSNLNNVSALLDLKGKAKGNHTFYPQIVGLPGYAQVLTLDSLTVRF